MPRKKSSTSIPSKAELARGLRFWAGVLGLSRRFTVKIRDDVEGAEDTYAARSTFSTDTDAVLVRFNPLRIHPEFKHGPPGVRVADEVVEFPISFEEVTRHEVVHLIVSPLTAQLKEYVRLTLQRLGLPEGVGQREYNAFQEVVDEEDEILTETVARSLGRAYEMGRRDALRDSAK